MVLKDRLENLRAEANLTQEDLANKIFVSRALVAKWESGERYPSKDNLARLAVIFLVGEALIVGGLSALSAVALKFGNLMLLYIVAIVKFSDVGGFALGTATAKLMKGGNHKMCPSVSPGKSWEGLFGSVVFSCAVSCAFAAATDFGIGKMLAFGVAAAVLGTAGDLVESKFKRWVGVKDSSAMKITNGMGGILDMVDSLLIAPVVLLFLI